LNSKQNAWWNVQRQDVGTILLASTILLLSGACAEAQVAAAPDQPPPNIVFFLADDLGVECVGAYGGEAYKTPVLDKMAAEGIRFEHCFAGPSCTPSRVALMTGKYNHRNYINFSMLPKGTRTFGHMMKDAGYRTCIVSKWQLGSGYQNTQGSQPDGAGFDQSCMKQGNTYWNTEMTINGEKKEFPEPYYGPDICCDFAVDFVKTSAGAGQPFFLYYAFNLPHWDFDATPDSADLTSRKEDKNFPDMVTYTDKLIGRVIAQLEASGVRDNTLLIFTGDNGTASGIVSPYRGTMRRGGKGSRRMDDARVPLIVDWPGKIKPGAACNDIIDFSDIYPTMADAIGRLDQEEGLDGRSFLPQVLGQVGTPRTWVASYFKGRDRGPNKNAGFFWIGDLEWKLDYMGKLFHVNEDPRETTPILAADDTPESAAARKRLQTALTKFDINCRNLWVIDQKAKPDSRGRKPVILHGKPTW